MHNSAVINLFNLDVIHIYRYINKSISRAHITLLFVNNWEIYQISGWYSVRDNYLIAEVKKEVLGRICD